MIIKCKQEDKDILLSYIGSQYPFCLYLYLNLIKYGIDSDTIDVFIQYKGNTISSILLKYYSCLHVYSKDNEFDADELTSFFINNGFIMLYCTSKTASRTFYAFPESLKRKATVTHGWVAQIISVDKESQGIAVPAKENDFTQIVRMIYDDEDIGRSYKYDELAKQLEERNREGYARNLVIKQDDLVIAHACTNAELDNTAVVAELLVRKEFRRMGYASEIWRDICGKLLAEGKEVYSFYFSDESRRLHHKIGFQEICDWSKVVVN